jgi:Zn-dependent peptidase ImmA (M78 family)
MKSVQGDRIEREASRLLEELEQRKFEIWDSPPHHPIDRIDPFKIASCLLRVRLEEPEEISLPGSLQGGNVPFRIAGYINRQTRVIAVARRFELVVRRFTLAHEIGHWQLHKGTVYFRDFPLHAGDHPSSRRPMVEQQANRFAEALLMPADLVQDYFLQVFREPTLRDWKANEELARWLSIGLQKRITVADLLAKGRTGIAMLVAAFKADARDFSLAERFRVSKAAMSYRLTRLHLV